MSATDSTAPESREARRCCGPGPRAGSSRWAAALMLGLLVALLGPAVRADAAPARFLYEACDSVLPGGGTPGAHLIANPGSPFAAFDNCASPGGSIGLQETGAAEAAFALWSIPIAATPGGYVESLAVSAIACGLGSANDHTYVYENEPDWPASNCSESQRLFHVHSGPTSWAPGAGFDIQINCDGAIGPCSAGPMVAAHYFAATEVDPNAPRVSPPSGSLLGGGPIRGHQTIAATLTDEGGGLAEAAVFVNGVLAGQPKVESCSVVAAHNPSVVGKVATSPTPCPTSDSVEWDLDTEVYPFHDGTNSVQVCGFDFSTLDNSDRGCSAAASVNVDNSCTPSAVEGGELLSAQFASSHNDTVTVGYGKAARIEGRLATDADDPVRGATLCVKMATLDSENKPMTVGSVTTDANGEYSYRVKPGPNRQLVIGYRHDSKQVARDVDYYAHIRPSLKLNPPVLQNGASVHLWGHLPGPRAARRVVVLQANVPGSKRWITFRRATTDGRGGFKSGYRFTSTTRRTRYRFRAVVPRQAGYPWVEGHSKPVDVLVSG